MTANTSGGADAARLLPMGRAALLVEVPSLEAAMALRARIAAAPPPGLTELLPAARTVLCRFATGRDAHAAAPLLVGMAAAEHTPPAGQGNGRDATQTADAGPVSTGTASTGPASTGPGGPAAAGTVTIDVVYDGDDLDAVAGSLGISRSAVVAAHTGTAWESAFIGFAPGFAYLAGGDARLTLPRRETPRTAVPAGSVAIAGGFSAVYPGSSPGGWHLLGRTDAELWRPDRDPPALLPPGTRVQFEAVRELVRGSDAEGDEGEGPRRHAAGVAAGATADATAGNAADAADADAGSAAKGTADATADAAGGGSGGPPVLRVERPGGLALVEDLGRPGFADVGVPASGAADREALRRANRLVGNPASAAAIEITGTAASGGFLATALVDTVVAVAGAPCSVTITRAPRHRPSARRQAPEIADLAGADWGRWADWSPAGDELPPLPASDVDADSASVVNAPAGTPLLLRAGDTIGIDFDIDRGAWRAMLAVRGGIWASPSLGSRSRDLLSGLGPAPLAIGDELRTAATANRAAVGAPEPDPALPPATIDEPAPLILEPGPRRGHLTARSRKRLTELVWRIRPDSNRVGVRLEPAAPGPDADPAAGGAPPLEHEAGAELASEGVVAGAVQVPPGGGPVIFGRDHPVTGGYPVVGVVSLASLDLLARLAPGRCVRLVSAAAGDPRGRRHGDHPDVTGAW